MEIYVGQQLGNYRLIRLLGQGGFADVYLAEHIHLRTQAAIKVLQLRLTENNTEAFLHEARLVAHLVHPHIIRVLDFGVRDMVPFLVMDYAPGGTLRQRYLRGTPLPPATLFPYITQIASALHYAHTNKLIHRDVKPENILIGANNEVLLSDFGLALIAPHSNARPKKDMSGTVTYMAPEQVQGQPRAASDQYALAVMVYEWLTANRPFQGSVAEIATQQVLATPPSLREKIPTLSPEIERVVLKALAKNPLQRFGSIIEFAQELQQACRNDIRQTNGHMRAQYGSQSMYRNPQFAQRDQIASFQNVGPQAAEQPAQVKAPSSQSYQPFGNTPLPLSTQSRLPATNTGHFPAPALSQMPDPHLVIPRLTDKTVEPQNTQNKTAFPQFDAGISTLEQMNADINTFYVASRALPTSPNLPKPPQHKPAVNSVEVSKKRITAGKEQLRKPGFSAQTWLLISLLLIALLVGGSIAGVLYFTTPVHPGGSGSSIQKSTSTSSYLPTGATPTVSASYPANGTAVINDPLITNQLHWDEGSPCNFVDGSYQIALPVNSSAICSAHATDYHNFIYQVQMTFNKMGQQFSSGGISFRQDTTTGATYSIEIFESGKYSFLSKAGPQATPKVIAGYPQDSAGYCSVPYRNRPEQHHRSARSK